MISKKQLAVALSKLKVFTKPDIRLEQYPTDSEIAAEVLWTAFMRGDISGKTVADLGCGTGVLGIGCLLLGADMVHFVDIDEAALATLRENLLSLDVTNNYDIHNINVTSFNDKADTVVMNPPFGVKNRHADKVFLEAAFRTSDIIYSFHTGDSKEFVKKIASDNDFSATDYFLFQFPIKQSYAFHRKRIQRVNVGCFRLKKVYK